MLNMCNMFDIFNMSDYLNVSIKNFLLQMIIILSVVDHKNIKVPDYLAPLYIGFGLCAILMSFGLNSDCALNPARDFSP